MTFGEKIYTLRKEKGLTQEKLAEQIEVSRQAVSRWEAGETMPDTETLIRICECLNVSSDYLIREDCQSDNNITIVKRVSTEPDEICPKKAKLHLISAIGFFIAFICVVIGIMTTGTTSAQLAVFCFCAVLSAVNAVLQFILFYKKR